MERAYPISGKCVDWEMAIQECDWRQWTTKESFSRIRPPAKPTVAV